MKPGALLRYLFALGLLAAIGFEIGLWQRAFDNRATLHDRVTGSEFRVVAIDGQPIQRIRPGFIITRVPLILVKPGARVLTLSKVTQLSGDDGSIELHGTFQENGLYQIGTRADGGPELVLTNK